MFQKRMKKIPIEFYTEIQYRDWFPFWILKLKWLKCRKYNSIAILSQWWKFVTIYQFTMKITAMKFEIIVSLAFLPVFAIISFCFKQRWLRHFPWWCHIEAQIHRPMWQRNISWSSFCWQRSRISTYRNFYSKSKSFFQIQKHFFFASKFWIDDLPMFRVSL